MIAALLAGAALAGTGAIVQTDADPPGIVSMDTSTLLACTGELTEGAMLIHVDAGSADGIERHDNSYPPDVQACLEAAALALDWPAEQLGAHLRVQVWSKEGDAAPIILGALDKSLIDAEIKANIRTIRACYINSAHWEAGRLVVKFIIDKDGTVRSAEAKETTLENQATVDCVLNVFTTHLLFPEPAGGGIVIVSYPFLFSPDGYLPYGERKWQREQKKKKRQRARAADQGR